LRLGFRSREGTIHESIKPGWPADADRNGCFGYGCTAFSLAGCGIGARVDARNDYQASAADYKACLAANPASPQNYEGLRLAMETDERKYNNLSAGLNPGGQRSTNVTVLNR
jgi:hypothetical protein